MAFQRLRQRLGGFAHDWVPTATEFMRIDVDKVAKELDLVDQGQARGRKNLPQVGATDFDEHENNTTNRILSALGQAKADYDMSQRAYSERLKGLNLSTRSSEIRTESRGAVSDFDTAHHSGADELYRKRLNILDAQKDLEDFRAEHGIRRIAHYPESKIYLWGFVAILFLIEAALNGNIFSQGHEFGLIGGIGFAALIAVLNIFVLGLVGALCFRLLLQPSIPMKILGYIATPSYFAFVLGLSLLGAHLRNEMNSGADDYARAALDSFLITPFSVRDATSLLFVVVTVAFAIGAAIDIFKMDDPIFGYGRRHRKLQETERDYAEMKATLVGEMTDIREDRVNFMNDQLVQMRNHLNTHQSIIENRTLQYSRFIEYLNYLENTGNTLLSRYRDANRETREVPEPAHFGKPWQLPRPPLSEATAISDEVPEVRRKVEETSEILEQSIHELETHYVSHVHRYDKIEELSREEIRDAQSNLTTT